MSVNDPMFTQFPEHDEAVAAWFESHGWRVTMRHFDFDRDVFAWRHEAPKVEGTLRITQAVLEDYPGDVIVQFLDASKTAATLERRSGKYVIARRRANGALALDVLDGPP